ncbi:hypothetical protein [Celeribacter naphthalenivorans]|uniref:hypothetical protein n=1 Tax=Celeribacter naphthalenivorans TaxID=1614694 RepID=UPI001CFAA82E|nr:hypothetical protein [Celeribacter naphthalenivorans]
MKRIASAGIFASALLSAPAASAQDTLTSWDQYLSFLGQSCVLDTLGLQSKMMAGMMARHGAGMTERDDRDGMDFYDHPNGTTLELSATDEEVLCRVVIPPTALAPGGIESLRAGLAEEIGYKVPSDNLETVTDDGSTEWSYDGSTDNRMTVRFSLLDDGGASVEAQSARKR